MSLTVTQKLFLAVFLTLGAILLVVLLVMGWSLRHGFSDYITRLELSRFDGLAKNLADDYAAYKSWDHFKDDRAAWHRLVRNSLRPPPNPPPPLAGPGGGPGRPGFGPPADRLLIGRRLALVDGQGRFVAGAERALTSPSRRAILAGGVPAGWLVMARSPGTERAMDAVFLSDQRRNLMLVGLAAVLAALLASLGLARHFLRPVHKLAQMARQLRAGDLGQRAAVRRRDELGQLAADMNQLASSLETAESARRRWVADTAHELRTPLSVLQAELEALRDGVRHADAQTYPRLLGYAGQLTRLVQDLHDLARADAGALTHQSAPLDLAALLGDIVAGFEPRFAERCLGLSLDAPKSLPMLGDADRLRQLFTNLLENSRRYTDPGGQLLIRARRQWDDIVVQFDDSAPAPPQDSLPYLFDRFYRVEQSRSRAAGGAGLGLAIARAIVGAHNGQMSVAASSLGGLHVEIRLACDGKRS